jgi:hypothetical protein
MRCRLLGDDFVAGRGSLSAIAFLALAPPAQSKHINNKIESFQI